MELNEIAVCSPLSGIMSPDSRDFTEMSGMQKQDFSKVCPLCSQEIKLYFINLEEKISMCSNLECDYPFGYETIEIIREGGGQVTDLKSCSQKSVYTNSLPSTVSTAALCDVEKLCTVIADDTIVGLDLDKEKWCKLRPKTEADIKREEIRKNVEKIREINQSLSAMKPKDKTLIKNEKWLKNLSYLQNWSGVNLVKPEEMKNINVNVLSGELKIDIDKSSGIKIEIQNPSRSNVNLH